MEPFDIRNYHEVITLKIGDFDEAKEHPQTNTMPPFVGTCAYMAPEVLRDQSFSKSSDVWRLAKCNTTNFYLSFLFSSEEVSILSKQIRLYVWW